MFAIVAAALKNFFNGGYEAYEKTDTACQVMAALIWHYGGEAQQTKAPG